MEAFQLHKLKLTCRRLVGRARGVVNHVVEDFPNPVLMGASFGVTPGGKSSKTFWRRFTYQLPQAVNVRAILEYHGHLRQSEF